MSLFRLQLFVAGLSLWGGSCGNEPANAPVPLGQQGQPTPGVAQPVPQPGAQPGGASPRIGVPQPGAPGAVGTQPGAPAAVGVSQPGAPQHGAAVQQIPGYVYIPPGTFMAGTWNAIH